MPGMVLSVWDRVLRRAAASPMVQGGGVLLNQKLKNEIFGMKRIQGVPLMLFTTI